MKENKLKELRAIKDININLFTQKKKELII